ncbi:MbtH family protein [Actinokineospora globicatena]|uniref:MbtH protein n=1 Tax=Actinokineospora globicatena TaxID=103729 RepID=A0A9W6QKP7_9PSEU|nr:MbtH family NRPS accessory protein [Actinokineospora globicatena]GLW79740.1 MbtH protein [Actinokineospora globicatena]GLW85850.1 MbtH protein [Actinokineospora globicatena]GLW90344.1 MbtH protein [Actinokineospora globicatena]
MAETDEDTRAYVVVVNDEEQYSIWPADRRPPAGWTAPGARGSKQECLDHIAEVWTDMRPRSLREAMRGTG